MKIHDLDIDTPWGYHSKWGNEHDTTSRKLLRVSRAVKDALSHHLKEIFLVTQTADDAQQGLMLSFS
jgi:hypothetical protein